MLNTNALRISMTSALRTFLSIAVVGAILCGSLAMAQLPTATILGVVKDSSGSVIPAASLTAKNVETGQIRTAMSAADGSYRFQAVPIGSYEIRAEHSGFQTQVQTGLTVSVSQEAVVNITLQVGTVADTVSVTADAPLVNTTSGALGTLVDDQKIAELPLNGRNYVDLMLLQPGINLQANKNQGGGQVGVWFSSNGAPVRSNNMLLDGAIILNMYGAGASSASGSTLGLDGIQEWRVVTNASSAEYGMNMGSQMLIVSKGGTNAFHGSAFEYLRNSAMDAANRFYVPSASNGFQRIPPYRRNNYGGSFGGPIKKDKTFFFGVYEGLRERLSVTNVDPVLPAACHQLIGAGTNNTTLANPTGCASTGLDSTSVVPASIQPILAAIPLPTAGFANQYIFTYSQPTNESYGQVRVDQNISASDTLFGRYTIDDSEQTQTGGYPGFTTLLTSRNQFVTASENHIFSPTLLNTARFSFSRTTIPQTDPPSGFAPFVTGATEFGRVSISGGLGGNFGSVPTAPSFVTQNIFTWSDDIFVTRGKHALKFGTLINHFQDDALRTTGAAGTLTYGSIANFMLGKPTSAAIGLSPNSVLGRSYRFNTLGFYAQDDIRLLSHLTVNVGLRYEFTTSYNEVNGHGASFRNFLTDPAPTVGPPFQNPSLHNVSPRIGFAWDVLGNSKVSVHGGYGLLYDIASLGFSLFQTNLVPPFGSSSTTVYPTPLAVVNLPVTFPSCCIGNTLNGIQWDLKQPQMTQYNLAVDMKLPGAMSMTVAYAGSRGRHLLRLTDGNPTIPQGVVQNGACVARPAGQAPAGNLSDCWIGGDPRLSPFGPTPTSKWGSDQMTSSSGDSWYNSLQVLVARRLSKGLELQGSFTWAKVIDLGQGQAGGESNATPVYPEYPQVGRLDRGPASFDISKNFRLNTLYRLPDYNAKKGFLGGLLSGWETAAIVSLQSGFPFTPVIQANRSRSGSAGGATVVDRPNLAPGRTFDTITSGTSTGCQLSNGTSIAAGTPLGTPSLYFDPCAFVLPAAGTLGNMGRDSLVGPAFANVDFSVIKATPLRFREGASLEFRAEIFNILNHPNFIAPQFSGNTAGIVFAGNAANATENPLPTAGVLNATVNSARQVQLALKLRF
jgi:outer membrane receptor protein involved in Fe transport